MVPAGQHVCIKVCKPKNKIDRRLYESWPESTRRQNWLQYKLGHDGVYVGRPKCDGGWYMSDEVKRGSMFANPFSLNV